MNLLIARPTSEDAFARWLKMFAEAVPNFTPTTAHTLYEEHRRKGRVLMCVLRGQRLGFAPHREMISQLNPLSPGKTVYSVKIDHAIGACYEVEPYRPEFMPSGSFI